MVFAERSRSGRFAAQRVVQNYLLCTGERRLISSNSVATAIGGEIAHQRRDAADCGEYREAAKLAAKDGKVVLPIVAVPLLISHRATKTLDCGSAPLCSE